VWKKLKKLLKERKRNCTQSGFSFPIFVISRICLIFPKKQEELILEFALQTKKFPILGVQKQQNCLKKERKNTGLE
jgi:hypothetical protein